MNNLLDRLSVGGKLLALGLFYGGILIGIVGYTLLTLNHQKQEGLVIDIAGRQRMLIQKYAKEVFDEASARRTGHRVEDSAARTAELFERSLKALLGGGATWMDLAMKKPVEIEAVEDPAVRESLTQVARLWERLRATGDELLASDPAAPGHGELLHRFRDLTQTALVTMNQAVGGLAAASAARVRHMQIAQWVILGLALVLSGLFSYRVSRSIAGPLGRVATAARKVADGDLNVDLSVLRSKRRDEVAQAAEAFGDMVEVLRRVQKDLQQSVEAAQAGDLSHRSRPEAYRGAWAGLVRGMNGVFEAVDQPLSEASDYLDRISRGQIPEPIETRGEGDFGRITDSLNRCIQAMGGLLAESRELLDAARHGNLYYRGDPEAFEGGWRELIEGFNGLFEALSAPINATNRALERLAQGDLAHQMTETFEGEFSVLQKSINTTLERLRETIGSVQQSAEAIRASADEIAAGNGQLSSRTEEQASALEETAASMEEITGTVKSTADNTEQATRMAEEAARLSDQGGEVVNQAITAMGEIAAASAKIEEIIDMIDEIAFQTNLLALNAAVEAARAGEHGRGFAVVATEVRNLAQRSASAAKEIKSLIEDSAQKVDAGTELVNRSGATLEEINGAVRRVSDLVGQIALASREQSAGIEQVNIAITRLDKVTQQNAALAQEASVAAADLNRRAQEMEARTAWFKVGEAMPADELEEEPEGTVVPFAPPGDRSIG